jgi:hypothetical protein
VGARQADSPTVSAAGGGELVGKEHALPDLQVVGVQSGACFVVQGRPGADQHAVDAGAGQADGPIVSGAGGGELVGEEHALPDLQVVRAQGGACVVEHGGAGAVQLAADMGPGQPDSPKVVDAGGFELIAEEHALVDPKAVGVQGGTAGVENGGAGAIELAADVCPGQADDPTVSGAIHVPLVEEHVLVNLKAVGVQGGSCVVAQDRPDAVQLAPDVGAGQADRSVLGVADDHCPGEVEPGGGGEPVGVQGCIGGVFEPGPEQIEKRDVGVTRNQAFLEEACEQLERDAAGEVFQV